MSLALPASHRPLHRPLARDVALTLLSLGLLLAWDASGFDLAVVRAFGDARGFAWRDAWFTRTLLHNGGRWLAWGVIGLMLADATQPLLAGPRRSTRWYWLVVMLGCALLVPATDQARVAVELPVGPDGVRRRGRVCDALAMGRCRRRARPLLSVGACGGGIRLLRRLLRVAWQPAAPGPDLADRRVRGGRAVRLGTTRTRRALPESHAVVGLVVLVGLRAGRACAARAAGFGSAQGTGRS